MNYLKPIKKQEGPVKRIKRKMPKIVIFASGSGSNANKIIQHFKNSDVQISLIATNNPQAGVLKIADTHNIPTFTITKDNFTDTTLQKLTQINPDLIVLAGFLWKIPTEIINIFQNKIINIHPSLLPKFGGKGMFGHFVHESVFSSKQKQSGITIHYVNENYDEGQIINQFIVDISECKNPLEIELAVRELEIQHFSTTIEKLLKK
jgi:phosphoribosylglycinamide formyltransferase-1